MKPIAPAERLVRNLQEGGWRAFQSEGVDFPGISFIPLDERLPNGTGLHFFKMAPGALSPGHEHTCNEYFYVIEGDLVDNDGTRYGPGDMVMLRAGTQHSSHSPSGCTLLVYIETLEKPLDY